MPILKGFVPFHIFLICISSSGKEKKIALDLRSPGSFSLRICLVPSVVKNLVTKTLKKNGGSEGRNHRADAEVHDEPTLEPEADGRRRHSSRTRHRGKDGSQVVNH